MARRSYHFVVPAALAAALLAGAASAQTAPPVVATDAAKPGPAQPTGLTINFGDSSIRLGALLQAQADWSQDAESGGYAENLFLRRTRIIMYGNLSQVVFFFVQTENSKLGASNGTTKTISTGLQMLDAVAEWRIAREFNLWGGLIYVPTSREALKGSPTEFMLDTSAYAYTATTALTGTSGRDTGFLARGYFLDGHLEYRAGLFQGIRETGSRNAYRFVGRLQYNLFDTEVYTPPAYTGSYLGAKKVLAIGTAYDEQMDYRGITADVFADIPTDFGSLVGTATYQHLDGGTTLTTLGKSSIFQIDAGAYIKGSKVGPWARYETRTYSGVTGKDEKRWLVGLNYYIKGHSANLKLGYCRLDPKVGRGTNEFTVQLQVLVF